MGCIICKVRIISDKKFDIYNKIKILNSDLIAKGNTYIKNCNCYCNIKETSKNGLINYNVDTLIMSYFNCSKCNKIRRVINNQTNPEGTFESRVDTVLNNVFLLLTGLSDFYDYENSKAIYDTFVLPVLNKLDTAMINNIYFNYNDELHKKLLNTYSSSSVYKFKNEIDWLIRPFMMELFFGRIWFNIIDGTENYKTFKHILWNGFDTELVLSNLSV